MNYQLKNITILTSLLGFLNFYAFSQCWVDAGNGGAGCQGSQLQLSAVGSSNPGAYATQDVCIYDAHGGDCAFTDKICMINLPPGDNYELNPGPRSSQPFTTNLPAVSIHSIDFKVYWTCGGSVTWNFELNGVQIGSSGPILMAGLCDCFPKPLGTYPKTFTLTGSQLNDNWNFNGTNVLKVTGNYVASQAKVAGYSAKIKYVAEPTFTWNPSLGLSDPKTANPVATIQSAPMTYTCTYTDNAGCVSTDQVTVSPEMLSATLTPQIKGCTDHISCNGGSDGQIDLEVNGGLTGVYSYSWSGPGGFTANTQDIGSLEAGMYYVTVSDQSGCGSIVRNIYLTEPDPLDISSLSGHKYLGGYNLKCHGDGSGKIDISVSGGNACNGLTYNWSGPNGFTASSANPAGLDAGDYFVTVTDSRGCFVTGGLNLREPPVIEITSLTAPVFPGNVEVSCHGATDGTIDLEVDGGTNVLQYNYNWQGPGGFTANTQDLANAPAGQYAVTVTDFHGCAVSGIIEMNEPSPMKLGQVSSIKYDGGWDISCSGASDGAVDVNVKGGAGVASYTYQWSGPGGFTSSLKNPSGLDKGNYSVVISDINGCNTSGNITLEEPAALSIDIAGTAVDDLLTVSCPGKSDGSINVDISGGAGPGMYSYSWSGPQGYASLNEDISGLPTGNYQLFVTDANGCTANKTFVISEPPPLAMSPVSSPVYPSGANVSCNGRNDGSASVSVSGGNSPYDFDWQGPGSYSYSGQNPTGMGAGSYFVTVTDDNGCTASSGITLTEPAPLPVPEIYFDGDELYTNVSVASYQWNRDGYPIPGAISAVYVPTVSGMYSLTISEGGICTETSDEIQVTISGVGIADELTGVQQIKVYPIPVRNDLFIEAETAISGEEVEITLMDINGKVIHSSKIQPTSGKISAQLSFEILPSGLYVLKIGNKTGYSTRKIVCNK